jgi:hypothetical protein
MLNGKKWGVSGPAAFGIWIDPPDVQTWVYSVEKLL